MSAVQMTADLALKDRDGGLFSDLDRRLIVAAQQLSNKFNNAALNKPHGMQLLTGRVRKWGHYAVRRNLTRC
jgi:hypothetical protein